MPDSIHAALPTPAAPEPPQPQPAEPEQPQQPAPEPAPAQPPRQWSETGGKFGSGTWG